MEDEPDRVQRVLQFNTERYIHRWQNVFNKSWATRSDLVLFVDVLEYYLYKKAKGKTEVKLNTSGLYKKIQIALMERPNGLDEEYTLPKGGKAWGLAIARLLDPSVGKFIGHWYMRSYKSNKNGRVYYMTRLPKDELYAGIWNKPIDRQSQTRPTEDNPNTSEKTLQGTTMPQMRVKEHVPDSRTAKILLIEGKVNTRHYAFVFQYKRKEQDRLLEACKALEEELGHELANQYPDEDQKKKNRVESVEEATNNKALGDLI